MGLRSVCLERFAAVPKTGSLRMRAPARSAFNPPVCTSAHLLFEIDGVY